MLQEDKCNTAKNKQPGGRLPQTMREQSARPPLLLPTFHLLVWGGCLGVVSGPGEEIPGLRGGGLMEVWAPSVFSLLDEEISFAISQCLHPFSGPKVISSFSGLDNTASFRTTIYIPAHSLTHLSIHLPSICQANIHPSTHAFAHSSTHPST